MVYYGDPILEEFIEEIFEQCDVDFELSTEKNEITIIFEPDVSKIKLRISEGGIILPSIEFVNQNQENNLLSYILERNYRGVIILWGYISYALCERGLIAYYDLEQNVLYLKKGDQSIFISANLEHFIFNSPS